MHIGKFLLVLVTAIAMFGCVSKEKKTEGNSNSSFEFLVLAPGSFKDGNTNQSCYEALQDIATRWKLSFHFYDNVKSGAVEPLVSDGNEQKYDFVIVLGRQLLSPLINVSAANPKLKSAVIAQYPGNFDNLGALSYQPSHHYLAGVVAAIKSKNGRVGAMIADETPQTMEEIQAFFDGVHRVNPEILTYSVTIDRSTDSKMAIRYAEGLKDSGVDVIFVNCGYAATNIYKWAAKNKVMTIGSVYDQYSKAPGWVLTSVLVDYNKMLSYAVGLMTKGQWQGIQYRFGMVEKVTDLAPFRGKLSAKQKEFFNEIYKEVAVQKGEVGK
jgi:basic membrane protein A